jgi:hypothetical protein
VEKHRAACEQDLREFVEETSERCVYIPAQLIVIEDVDHPMQLSFIILLTDNTNRCQWPVFLRLHRKDRRQGLGSDFQRKRQTSSTPSPMTVCSSRTNGRGYSRTRPG